MKERIEELSVDIKVSYRNAIEEILGPKVRICADLFHVGRAVNNRVGEMRKVSEEVHFLRRQRGRKSPKGADESK